MMTIVHRMTKNQAAGPLAVLGAVLLAVAPANAQTIKAAHGRDLAGHAYTLPSPGAKATVMIFVQHDCPICNGYAPAIQRLADSYAKSGAAFALIYAEPGLAAAQAVKHAHDYGYRFPCILDGWRTLVKETGVTTAPEAVVLDSAGRIAYRGRIDNRFAALGVQRTNVTEHDLRNAIVKTLSGKTVTPSRTQSIGCFITP
jgi:thiol-disulfide isomerase/thioredoxin